MRRPIFAKIRSGLGMIAMLLPVWVASGIATGCASSLRPADRLFEKGQYAEAAEAYRLYLEGAPAGEEAIRARFRLGLTYALPESSTHDAERAKRLLKQLITLYPESPYSHQAAQLLELQRELGVLQEDVAARQDSMGAMARDAEVFQRTIDELERSIEGKEEEAEELKRQLQSLNIELTRLQNLATEGEAKLQELIRQLIKLKEIDLGRPVPAPPESPDPEPEAENNS